MNNPWVLSAVALSLPTLLGFGFNSFKALTGPRSDALLAFMIGVVLIAASTFARALANLSGKGGRLASRSARSAHPAPSGKVSSVPQSTTDVA